MTLTQALISLALVAAPPHYPSRLLVEAVVMSDQLADPAVEEADTELETVENRYPWATNLDEWRRCFVFERMGCSEIAADTLIKNMHAATEWLRTGEPPVDDKPGKRAKLKVVDASD